MGLSRNKVAVPEGAAGTPPFWSPCTGRRDNDEKKSEEKSRYVGLYFTLRVFMDTINERKMRLGIQPGHIELPNQSYSSVG